MRGSGDRDRRLRRWLVLVVDRSRRRKHRRAVARRIDRHQADDRKAERAAADELEETDLVEGTGAEAKAGDEVTVQYVGVNYKTGKEFDASWDRGEPFTFTLGSSSVIPGWEQGVEGMKEGGRRQLVIPPELGYGEAGAPPAIPPNETLVFVVDLLKVK